MRGDDPARETMARTLEKGAAARQDDFADDDGFLGYFRAIGEGASDAGGPLRSSLVRSPSVRSKLRNPRGITRLPVKPVSMAKRFVSARFMITGTQ